MNFTAGVNNGTDSVQRIHLFMVVGKIMTVVFLGIAINYINATMIHTFFSHHIFKMNPRFILFIHLVVNDMIQLITSISLLILAYTLYTTHVPLCCLLIIPAVVTTQNTPLNITFMAVECYIAVCFPLHYNQICTAKKAYIVIGMIWTMGSLTVLPDVIIFLVTESQEFMNSRVVCLRDGVFRSAYILKKQDVSHKVFLVVVWLTIFYTYFRILLVVKAADAEAKKARNTLLIHGFQVLMCMMVYVDPMLVAVLIKLFPGQFAVLKFFSFILNQILPRCISPVVYGLRDKTFRKYFKRYLCSVNSHPKISPTGPF
ncbi:odorant receptor 131-2-like isoform X2 [Notolabrus celidotus]|nr:odorant receptor 131-2-like isoform X2 [Notolabrus celidotus]XP_034564703.1 odorant receptor 131-2-like isoform X2 [Notolabrus celidotus]